MQSDLRENLFVQCFVNALEASAIRAHHLMFVLVIVKQLVLCRSSQHSL